MWKYIYLDWDWATLDHPGSTFSHDEWFWHPLESHQWECLKTLLLYHWLWCDLLDLDVCHSLDCNYLASYIRNILHWHWQTDRVTSNSFPSSLVQLHLFIIMMVKNEQVIHGNDWAGHQTFTWLCDTDYPMLHPEHLPTNVQGPTGHFTALILLS